MTMSLVNWNVQWATPRSRRTTEIRKRIDLHSPDVICLTETAEDLLSPDGYVIYSQPDFGYALKKNRRKVLLWSRYPWERVDDLGHRDMPPGRYVSGVTRTPVGEVTVVGTCIPWSGSRSEDYRESERKERWEDHARYLKGLTNLLEDMQDRPLIVAGDFNQRIGQGKFVPHNLQKALENAMPKHVTIATSVLGHKGRRCIDHIALSEEFAAESMSVISNIASESKLSDHCGVAAVISVQSWNL